MMGEGEVPSGKRFLFLDNIRTFMIFLVVLNHAGVVYESSGFFAPYWLVDDPATNDAVGIINLVLDLFVMPAIFFVSGFLAPASLKRRPGWSFVASRFRRLMIPWLVAVLTLMPLYKMIFLYSRGLPQEHWTTYFHFSNGVISQNWLWFLPVLFLFDATFWLLSKTGIRPPRLSMTAGILLALAAGTLWGFTFSILGNTGWTKTAILDFQNEKLLIYFTVFLVGALAWWRKVFESPPPKRKVLYIVAAATAWIPINVYAIVLLTLLFRPGEYFVSLPVDLLVLWLSSELSLLVLLYLTIETSRYWFDGQRPLGRALSANSYGVYVIHVIVLGGIATLLLGVDLPSIVKYAILVVTTWVASNLLVQGYRELRHRLASTSGKRERIRTPVAAG